MSRKIIGVTVGTQLPKPNFKQTDPTKGDYIKNKPDFEGLEAKVDQKADLVDGKVPLEQLPDNIGSGGNGEGLTEVTWEDIKNKPFGEINQSIEWDGTPTDECIMEDEGVGFYKVSDTYCDAEALIGKTVNIFSRETNDIMETATITADSIVTGMGENVFGIMVGETPAILMLSKAGMVGEMEFSSAGAWFMSTPEMFVGFLEITQVEQIDKKFIPSDIGTWAGMPDKPFGETGFRFTQEDVSSATTYVTANIEGMEIPWRKVSEPYNGTLINAKIKMDGDAEIVIGVDSDFPLTELDSASSYMSYVFNMLEDNETISVEELGITSLTIPEKGLYIIDGSVMEMTLEYFQSPDYGEIKQLDEKFIPDVFVKSANVGVPNGVATLDADGKVPASQLPDNIGGGSGSGSGVTSWNDLEDKPFYSTGYQIEWDTNPTNEFVPIDGDAGFYKVSNLIPTKEELIGATLKAESDGDHIDVVLTDSDIEIYDDGCYGYTGMPLFLVTTQAKEVGILGMSFSFPSAGVWFVMASGVTWAYYLGKGETKQLDPKFIPNYFGEVGFYTNCDASKATATVSVPVNEENFGSSEFRYLKFAEPIDGSIQGYLLSVVADGQVMEISMGDEEMAPLFVSDAGSEYTMYVLNIKTDNETVNMEDFGFPIFTVAEAGLYVFDASLMGTPVNYFKSPDYSIIKIDEKYLPEGIGGAASSSGCRHYTGGYIIDKDKLIVMNYYNLLASVDSSGNFDYEAALYNITGTDPFVITFLCDGNVSFQNNPTIQIATGYNGGDSLDGLVTDIQVELLKCRQFEQGKWVSYLCIYSKISGKWQGNSLTNVTDVEQLSKDLNSRIDSLETSIDYKQNINNLVTSINNNSADSQYPSAKLLYDTKVGLETQITDAVSTKQDKSNLVTNISSSSTNEQYPSAKLLYDTKTSIENVLQFDTTPTANSGKLVKSGAIATALNDKVSTSTLNSSVNNLTTEINKKANQSDVNTSINNLTTEIGKKADSDAVYTKNEIDGLITGVFYYKGSVDTFAELPVTAKVGDTYNVKTADTENNVKAGDNVVWCEVGGVGHWDVLSGIVDLSAYWTGEEVQGKLDEVQDRLDEKANVAELSEVAKSNDYLDLDNKPCYYVGVDQTVVGSRTSYQDDNIYPPYRYPKKGEYNFEKTVQDYIDGFVSCSYGSDYIGFIDYTDNNWTIKENGIAVYIKNSIPWIFIVPANGLSYIYSSDKTFMFDAGIYCLIDMTTFTGSQLYIKEVKFETKYTPFDINYLPQHNHTVSEIIDVQNALSSYAKIEDVNSSLTTKVDVDPNARLMTNSEASKLAKIEDNANNYTLPAATTNTLGGVKIGENLSVSEDGTISATSLDWNNVANKPELYTKSEVDTSLSNKQDKSNLVTGVSSISTDAQYPSAKLLYNTKTNLENSIATKVDKVSGSRLMTEEEGAKLAGIEDNANNYTLPAATTTSLGGVKVGANLSVSEDGTISATSLDWNNVANKPELYTKSEVYNKDEVYTKDEVYVKADVYHKDQVYTRDEISTYLGEKQDKSNLVTSVDSNSTDSQYPSAKLLYDILGDCNVVLNEISALIGE